MVFIQNQMQEESKKFYTNDYSYLEMFKNDKKNIDKNILRHTKYINKVLKERDIGNKIKNKNN